jgi:hypothetical protein
MWPLITGHMDNKKGGCLYSALANAAGSCQLSPVYSNPHHSLSLPGARSLAQGTRLSCKHSSPVEITHLHSDKPSATLRLGPGTVLFIYSLIQYMCRAWGRMLRISHVLWNINSHFPSITYCDLGRTHFFVLPTVYLCHNTY